MPGVKMEEKRVSLRCKDENGVECIAMPETKFEYLKDRPFYNAFEDTTHNVGPGSENPDGLDFYGQGFGEGDTVDIIVDGEKLSLVAAKFSDYDHVYYVGATPDEISTGSVSGEYDWCYACDENSSSLISLTNHAFTVKEKVTHKLPMEYSPVSIQSSGLFDNYGDYVSDAAISRLTIYNLFAGPNGFDSIRGVLTNYDENSNTYELNLYADQPYFSLSFAFTYETSISSLKINPLSWTIDKSKFENNTSLKGWLGGTYTGDYFNRPVFFRDIVIDKSRFDPMLFQTTDGLTGSFVTAAGNLISVVVKFNSTSTSGRFNQDWTLTLTLIG